VKSVDSRLKNYFTKRYEEKDFTKQFPEIKYEFDLSFNKMDRIFYILILLFVLMLVAHGQEPKDTSTIKPNIFDSGLSIVTPPVLSNLSFRTAPAFYPTLLQSPFTLGMRSFSWKSPERIDLVSPWQYELTKQEELRTLRTILGTVQLGGVAYLAYRHIKKYGLK
jgi:hypothetical protein